MHDIRQTVVTAMIQSSCIRPLRALAVGALLAFGTVPVMAPAALAQSDLSGEVRRLRDDLTALQRQVYRGGTPPATVAGGGGGGELSGEIAIRLSDRIAQLETQIQQLTGRTEEIDFRTAQMQRRLDKLVEDIDFRLSSLEKAGSAPAAAAPAGAPPAQQGAVPPPPAPAVAPPSAAPPAPAAPPAVASRTSDPNTPARPEGVLGTLRTGPGGQVVGATQAPGAATPTPPPAAPAAPPRTASKLQGNNPTEQYNYAFRLLNQGDYGDAEQAFTEFIKANPADPLAGNAQYWLAETFYVRKEYEKAAAGFLAGYQKYPKSSKAPDSLVKLGKTLNDLNQKQEACAVFVQFNKDFPNAPTALKALANTERQRAACR